MEDLRQLAERVAAIDDEDVIDSADIIARMYRSERLVAMALCEPGAEEGHPLTEACVTRLRERLKALLTWAEATGRA